MSQQLVKKGANGKHENVMPRSWIEAIKDKNTGQTLVEILQGFNMYFLPYNGNTTSTRCLVPTMLRKKGLWITYVKYDGNVYTEWYAADGIDDKSWGDSSNWRIGNNTLVGDITISANGNWVINGTETEFKAVGEKGNTPLLRVANNRLQVSYDLGDTYRDVTNNPVYTKFRWLATTGDTQANNVGRIQASTDEGKTWTNMSNDFTNNLHISRYIGVNESLPTSGIAEGTIYAKGPYYDEVDTLNNNPIYRLWVYAWKDNTLAWQDNGEFTSIAAGVVQETGNSETEVMSQKAVSDKLSELGLNIKDIEYFDDGKSTEVKEATGYYLYSSSHDFSVPSRVRVELSEVASVSIIVYLSESEASQVNIKQLGVINKGSSVIDIFDVKSDTHNYVGIAVDGNYKGTVSITIIPNTQQSFANGLDTLQDDYNRIELYNKIISSRYIRYEDGVSVGLGGYFMELVYDAKSIKHIEAFLYSTDTIPAAIAFYNSDVISADSYMLDASKQHLDQSNVGRWYKADVPSDAKLIVLTTRTDSSKYNPIVKYTNTEQFILIKNKLKEMDDSMFVNDNLSNFKNGWIKHGTGEYFASSATKCFIYDVTLFSVVKAFLRSDTNVIDAISFFSGDEISADTYMSESVAWAGNYLSGLWYEAKVPKGAKLMCVTSGIQENFPVEVLFLQAEYIKKQDTEIVKLNESVKSIDSVRGDLVLGKVNDIYHFGMSGVVYRDVVNVIPSQSIFDVRNAKKLGYTCIEANLHKTLDGKYVVTHGQDGKLGHDFSDLEGNDAYGVLISSTSYDDLRNNYRYYTPIKEYQVSITSLEEFCSEAKRCGLIVMLQYKDIESIDIARGILGDSNLFMYNAPRDVYKGAILEYQYYDNKQSIISRCETVGKPYVYSMDNPYKFDDETLKDICSELKRRGFYIASAYVGKDSQNELRGLGFDFFAVTDNAKLLKDNQSVVDGNILTFNEDGSVSWEKY